MITVGRSGRSLIAQVVRGIFAKADAIDGCFLLDVFISQVFNNE